MDAAMSRMLIRMRSAGAVESSMRVNPEPLWSSPMPRRITPDETLHIHLRLPARPGTAPRLRFDEEVVAPPEITWLSDDLVARIVAARQITHTAEATIAAEIAERYQLVTDHSNLLLVFERADSEKTDGLPSLRMVQPMLAAGSSGTGLVRRDSVVRPAAPRSARRYDDYDPPAVWRSPRAVAEPTVSSASGAGPGSPALEPAPTVVALSVRQAALLLVRAFNDAVAPGLSFRQVLGLVTQQAVDSRIVDAVVRATGEVGTQIKGWACFLMWAHELNDPEARLSDAALALVRSQLAKLESHQREAAIGMLDAVAA
jgi:hypothetical protein